MKFHQHLRSAAAKAPVEVQSNWKSLDSIRLVTRGPWVHPHNTVLHIVMV